MDKTKSCCQKTLGTLCKCSQNPFVIAIIAYLLVAYIKQTIKSDYSIYELMQILGVSAFDKTPIRELLTEQRQFNQNVKEQLSLFEC